MLHIDFERGVVIADGADGDAVHPLGSAAGFNLVSRAWLRAGWDAKYVYGFTWMGRPIIQLPEDLLRIQEVIYALQPNVIVETGIAHGGSLMFYASLCKTMGKGRVIGVDVELRPANRRAIEAHVLAPYLTLIDGSSIDAGVVDRVRAELRPGDTVLVVLDSRHTRDHVSAELEAYAPMVSVGSYIVAADGIMSWLGSAPRTDADWAWNNPREAVRAFAAAHPNFVLEEPVRPFNEGAATDRVTYWLDAFLKRVSE